MLAASGLRHLLERRWPRGRGGLLAGALAVVALADLATVPFPTYRVPPVPACYGWIRERDPDAVILDAPHYNDCWTTPSLCTYWQSIHRLRTSAGYTANANRRQDDLLTFNSPFHAPRLADPAYLADPEAETFDLVKNIAFDDYTWLYLTRFGFDYVVLHRRPGRYTEAPVRLERIQERLDEAKVFGDADAIVYARDRLRPPSRPVLICTEGWGHRAQFLPGRPRAASRCARLTLYNPTPEKGMRLTVEATPVGGVRTVRLRSEGEDLARWEVRPRIPPGVDEPRVPAPAGDGRIDAGARRPRRRAGPHRGLGPPR